MLQVKNIQKSYGNLAVLSGVSFSIERGQKAALVGPNGTGKSTLLRILAGLEEADAGEVELAQGARVAYLPQDTSLVGEETVSQYLRRITGVEELESELRLLEHELSDPEKASLYNDVTERYEQLEGYSFNHRMQVILTGFGLGNSIEDRSLVHLSSGQKTKVALAGILLGGADLLLLDEPTNNLDLPALIWLEDFLKNSHAACIIVSHDRRFLDRVVRKIFELDWITRTVTSTSGTYTDFIERSVKELKRAKAEYHLQKEEIERLTEVAKEQKASASAGAKWKGSDGDKLLRGFKRDRAGRSGRAAKAIEKRIEQMDKLERPIERDPFEIGLEAERLRGTLSIGAERLIVGYRNGFQSKPLSITIRYGERVGILGMNGEGKSTLLKTLTGVIKPIEGEVLMGTGVKIGNMMQEHESLPRDVSMIDYIMSKTGLDEPLAFNKLIRFGLKRSQVRAAIGTLSPGGRARFLLALFSAQSVNTLVLDEPTNHLDIEALSALEDALEIYKGTVILVSHDRYFMEVLKLDSVYELSEGRLTRIPSYNDYLVDAEKRAEKLIRLL